MSDQNFEIFAGDSKTLSVQVLVGDTSTPKDITGATIRWLAYNRRQQTAIDKSSSGGSPGITITDAGQGEFDIAINPADTETLPNGLYRHEAEMTDVGGRVSTVLVGSMLVKLSKA